MLKLYRRGEFEDIVTILIIIGATFALLMIISTVMFKTQIEAIGALKKKVIYTYPGLILRSMLYPTYRDSRLNGTMENTELISGAVYHLNTKNPFYVPYGDTRINVSNILNETISRTPGITYYNFSVQYEGNKIFNLLSGRVSKPIPSTLETPTLFQDSSKSINLTFTIPR